MGKELQEAKGAIWDAQQKLAEQSVVRAGSLPAPGTQGYPCSSASPGCHALLLELAGGGCVVWRYSDMSPSPGTLSHQGAVYFSRGAMHMVEGAACHKWWEEFCSMIFRKLVKSPGWGLQMTEGSRVIGTINISSGLL